MTTLIAQPITGSAGIIAKAAREDEGAAMTLLRFALYETLCDEVDRVRPYIERHAAQHMAKRAQGALEHIAKRYATATEDERRELEAMADELVPISKAARDWDWHGNEADERDSSTGRFKPKGGGRVRQGVLDLLGLSTDKGPEKDIGDRTAGALDGLVGDKADAYSRLRVLGQGLMATGDPTAQAAGVAARVVGNVGPEAQRALEPGIRRTAYRYRGTERRPSKELQRSAAILADTAADDGLERLSVSDAPGDQRALKDMMTWGKEIGEAKAGATRQLSAPAGKPRGSGGPISTEASALLGAELLRKPGTTPDQERLNRTAEFGALSLVDQIPDIESARISLAAGKMPPSVGLMFDEDGSMVSEAMGFNGDHYLPFDLKNLKRLKGGSYVRTRTTGGLTDEDIYTGLMTGARSLTVVSNSGVFTVEFDPDLRGGRRYSDKARSMVDRYSRITGEIASGKLLQNPLPPEEMKRIRTQAFEMSGGDEKLARSWVEQETNKAILKARYEGLDEEAMWAEAHQAAVSEGHAANGSSTRFQQARNDHFRRIRDEKQAGQARTYRLDGDGYAAAQKALQTEFPYFIRAVRHQPMAEYLTSRRAPVPEEMKPRGSDIGYTERNELAPRGVFGGRSESDPKQTARNEQARTGRRPRAERTEDTPAETSSTASTTSGDAAADRARQAAGAAPPAARLAGAVPVNLQEPDAPTLEEAAKGAQTKLRQDAIQALSKTMTMSLRVDTGEAFMPDPDNEGHPLPKTSGLVFDQTPLAYADWATKAFSSMGEYTNFLAKEDTDPKHLEYAKRALEELKTVRPSKPEAVVAPEVFDEAIRAVDALGGGKDLFSSVTPSLLEVPDPSKPRPLALPEIVELRASLRNVEAYARAHPGVVEKVLELQKAPDLNAKAAEIITPKAIEISTLIEWGEKGGPAPRNLGDGAEARRSEARGMATPAGQANHPAVRELADYQRAWSLLAAAKMIAQVTNQKDFDFSALVGKALGAVAPAFSKRGPRVVLHDRRGPVAKAYARRLQRPARR